MEPLKKTFTILGELVGGILQPNNSLLFARSLFFWVIIATVIAIPLFSLFVSQNAKKASQQGEVLSLPDALLAEVGKQKIYKSDVEKLIRENYSANAVTETVLKRYLDILIERAVLDQEAVKLKVAITNQEIESALAQTPFTNPNISQEYKEDQVRYNLLKTKIINTQVAAVQAYVIGFWIPPKLSDPELTFEETPDLAQRRSDGELALIEIRDGLSGNKAPQEIAQQIVESYPSLYESLTVNGYNFAHTKDTSLFEKPRAYIKNEDRSRSGINDSFYETLFSLKEGEVKTVLGANETGGDVIKLESVQLNGFNNYQEYLQSRISESVIKHI